MLRACTLLLFGTVLVYLAAEDLRRQKIHPRCVKGILILALLSMVSVPEISLVSRVLGMFEISIPMLLLAAVIPGSFGGGDIKLVFACGAFLGRELVKKGVALAVLLAGIYCLWLLLTGRGKRTTQFAFGPFLSVGFLISVFGLF